MMDQGDMRGQTGDAAAGAAPATVGLRLRAARDAQGLSLADVAARTRVTQRYLEAIELGRPQDLPSATYAVGFAKAYARAVGLDQVAVGHDVRQEMSAPGAAQRPHHRIEEIADPARGPSRGVAIVASGLALAVLVLAVLLFASGVFRGTGEQPAEAPVVAGQPSQPPASSTVVPPAATGPVVLTATDEVWLRVYDAADNTLKLGTMQRGDRFEVPADANDPMLNVGRPDRLAITVGGQAVPPLGDGSRAIKDVRIDAAALAGRTGATPDTAPSSSTETPRASSSSSQPNPRPRQRTPSPRASSSVPPAFQPAPQPGASESAPAAAATPGAATQP